MIKQVLVLVVIIGVGVGFAQNRGKTAGVKTEKTSDQQIRGLILPHHQLAGEKISEGIEKVKEEAEVGRIVILSPNHFRPNSYTFTVSLKLPEVITDTTYVQKLIDADLNVEVDEKLVEKDHGLVVPLKYLSGAYPDARYVGILISPYFNKENLLAWSRRLSELSDTKTLFVVSADFSHDNSDQVAYTNDQDTISAISSFDLPTVYGFKDDHLDNPAGMGVMLNVMKNLNASDFEVWYRGHGAEIVSNPILKGTSYVIGVFRSVKSKR